MNLDTQSPTVSATAAKPRAPKLVAVIDIGATSIRMAIAEIGEGGHFHTLESLAQAVSLGKDTFSTGAIDPATTEECVRVLKSYREKLSEYGITRSDQARVSEAFAGIRLTPANTAIMRTTADLAQSISTSLL